MGDGIDRNSGGHWSPLISTSLSVDVHGSLPQNCVEFASHESRIKPISRLVPSELGVHAAATMPREKSHRRGQDVYNCQLEFLTPSASVAPEIDIRLRFPLARSYPATLSLPSLSPFSLSLCVCMCVRIFKEPGLVQDFCRCRIDEYRDPIRFWLRCFDLECVPLSRLAVAAYSPTLSCESHTPNRSFVYLTRRRKHVR